MSYISCAEKCIQYSADPLGWHIWLTFFFYFHPKKFNTDLIFSKLKQLIACVNLPQHAYILDTSTRGRIDLISCLMSPTDQIFAQVNFFFEIWCTSMNLPWVNFLPISRKWSGYSQGQITEKQQTITILHQKRWNCCTYCGNSAVLYSKICFPIKELANE